MASSLAGYTNQPPPPGVSADGAANYHGYGYEQAPYTPGPPGVGPPTNYGAVPVAQTGAFYGQFQQAPPPAASAETAAFRPQPAAPPPAVQLEAPKRQETEEERKKRKERERRHYDQMKRAQQKSRQSDHGHQHGRPGAKPPGGKEQKSDRKHDQNRADNRLSRPTTFQAKIRFRNDLPEVLSEPKLLETSLDKNRYTKYTITSLEKNYRYKLLVEPDLGIPLDLLDLSAYNAPPGPKGELAPEDAALLEDNAPGTARPVQQPLIKKKDRPVSANLKWLMQTTYIGNTADMFNKPKSTLGLSEKQAKQMRDEEAGGFSQDDWFDRTKQIRTIESSFVAASKFELQPPRPGAKVVEVLPLLPDLDRSALAYLQVLFDNAPTQDSEKHAQLDPAIRTQLEAQAMLKFYRFERDAREPDQFVGYMVPDAEELLLEDDSKVAMTYDWVREYNWSLPKADTGRDNYLLFMGESEATYVRLPTKMVCKKRKVRDINAEDEDEEFLPPRQVAVTRRTMEEIEEDKRLKAVRKAEEEHERLERRQRAVEGSEGEDEEEESEEQGGHAIDNEEEGDRGDDGDGEDASEDHAGRVDGGGDGAEEYEEEADGHGYKEEGVADEDQGQRDIGYVAEAREYEDEDGDRGGVEDDVGSRPKRGGRQGRSRTIHSDSESGGGGRRRRGGRRVVESDDEDL